MDTERCHLQFSRAGDVGEFNTSSKEIHEGKFMIFNINFNTTERIFWINLVDPHMRPFRGGGVGIDERDLPALITALQAVFNNAQHVPITVPDHMTIKFSPN